jgi:hypothetical protein
MFFVVRREDETSEQAIEREHPTIDYVTHDDRIGRPKAHVDPRV